MASNLSRDIYPRVRSTYTNKISCIRLICHSICVLMIVKFDFSSPAHLGGR